jgi:hypothetical protein
VIGVRQRERDGVGAALVAREERRRGRGREASLDEAGRGLGLLVDRVADPEVEEAGGRAPLPRAGHALVEIRGLGAVDDVVAGVDEAATCSRACGAARSKTAAGSVQSPRMATTCRAAASSRARWRVK